MIIGAKNPEELKEEYRKLEPYLDVKNNYALNIIVHFFARGVKIEFTDYLFMFECKGKPVASGRFMDREKIKVEGGKLTKKQQKFFLEIVDLLINNSKSQLIYV
jgi:hypothetical protein